MFECSRNVVGKTETAYMLYVYEQKKKKKWTTNDRRCVNLKKYGIIRSKPDALERPR